MLTLAPVSACEGCKKNPVQCICTEKGCVCALKHIGNYVENVLVIYRYPLDKQHTDQYQKHCSTPNL